MTVPWANGLGTTRVITRWPDHEHWAWRLSLADVVSDGPFSQLPGIDRCIAVASGAGMDLTVGDGAPVRLTSASPALSFDGDEITTCTLVDGPIVDVNLMLRRGAATGSLDVVHLSAGDAVDVPTACVVLSGSVGVDHQALGVFDAVIEPCRVIALELSRLALVLTRQL
ncbi:MAG: HutD family protein [Ilumatobacteraceae bacterium]|nr:HutD family protein [Ilumatobacteraceae bacterium]